MQRSQPVSGPLPVPKGGKNHAERRMGHAVSGKTLLGVRRNLRRALKTITWHLMEGVVRVARVGARSIGRVRRVDVLVYKVDRLGDWFFAEQSLTRIVAATRARGGTVIIWASRESALMRRWRECEWPIETLAFEPQGLV